MLRGMDYLIGCSMPITGNNGVKAANFCVASFTCCCLIKIFGFIYILRRCFNQVDVCRSQLESWNFFMDFVHDIRDLFPAVLFNPNK